MLIQIPEEKGRDAERSIVQAGNDPSPAAPKVTPTDPVIEQNQLSTLAPLAEGVEQVHRL